MLPDTAEQYFKMLSVRRLADESTALSRARDAYERDVFSKGRQPGSGAYSGGLADLYAASFDRRVKVILDTLIEVHTKFEQPLDDVVDAQLSDWGLRAVSNAFTGLEQSYVGHIKSFGGDLMVHPSGLAMKHSLAQATVQTTVRHHLWELRHVPHSKPARPSASQPSVQITNTGVIGSIQTGAGSTASVQQQWIEGDAASLRSALDAMRAALLREQAFDEDTRDLVVKGIRDAQDELSRPKPRRLHLGTLLGGIAVAVQTVAALAPSWDAVKAAARQLGLEL